MPKAKEFTITIEDKPGALGACLSGLAQKGVNILAFQSWVEGVESLLRVVVDDPAAAKSVLGAMRMIFEETDVVIMRVPHQPGQLARAATRLGENRVNIDYSYLGADPNSNQAILVFGVDSLTRASNVLDELTSQQ